MKGAEKYPVALAALERLVGALPSSSNANTNGNGNGNARVPTEFVVGPAVLRAPPEIARANEDDAPGFDVEPPDTKTDEMLGELVDMVFVGADDSSGTGHHEVHLVFKAEVLGGLHLRLRKMPDGMHATFVVEDAAARRAVADHIVALVVHLRERGFHIASHAIEVASQRGAP